jgi:p-hydroxybenzoate 3-monooxygenase
VEVMRSQVAIVGAGPAGLVLAHLLHLGGVESVILEARSRAHVEQRVRAGVLEHPTVQLLCDSGVGERLQREGLRHRGISLRFDGTDHHLDFVALTGRSITVYGQQEVVKDLIAARLAAGQPILFDVDNVRLHGIDTDDPAVAFTDADGVERTLRAPVVAGCDGFHGICRPSIPPERLRIPSQA